MNFLPSLPCLSVLIMCLASVCNPSLAKERCGFPAIFNFGDSNSDTGAMSAATTQFLPPYGDTYFGMPSGRASDGRLIIDFLAHGLSLPSLGAYLDSLGPGFNTGANFAMAGATVLPQTTTLASGFTPLHLSLEHSEFSQFISRSQIIKRMGGQSADSLPPAAYFSQALYTVDIGQNDINNIILQNMTVDEAKATVDTLVHLISQHVEGLYDLGAKYFWIHNTGPIGCLAGVITARPVAPSHLDSAGCAKPYNEIARYFNQMLNVSVLTLRQALPKALITYVDIYSIKYSFFAQPEQYGFVEPLSVCCGGGGGKYNYDWRLGCGKVSGSCPKPSTKVIWDGVHYTEAANRATFNLISTGKYSSPQVPPDLACQNFEFVYDDMADQAIGASFGSSGSECLNLNTYEFLCSI